jgi:hypothetical protein
MSWLTTAAATRGLTSKSARRTIVLMRLWQRGILAALVLVAFCGSAWATCAEGAIASQAEQMACCKAGHDHCPMKDSASDCCKQSGPQVQSQATIVKVTSTLVPVPTLLASVTFPSLSFAAQIQPRVSFDSSPPDARVRPPAYVLFSTFLI